MGYGLWFIYAFHRDHSDLGARDESVTEMMFVGLEWASMRFWLVVGFLYEPREVFFCVFFFSPLCC